jgi:hypothetical protein
MGTSAESSTFARPRLWSGLTLLFAGLMGHVLAARAIGGTYVAYRDHLGGFAFLTLVTGALLFVLGKRIWRGERSWTVLWLGVVQAAFGLFAYITRFSLHG